MPTFKVNGVTASTTEGAVTVAATNSFTIAWSGLDSATNYSVKFQIEATKGSYMDLTNSAGTSSFLYYYTTPEYADSSWQIYKAIGTSGSDTITSASNLAGYTLTINYRTTFEGATYYVTFVSPSPTITKQPTISSINPSSGASTTITWSAATVSNQGNSTIYYQYFVGPNSTYSDSYHIGTTTGTSATITEAQIISKCGNGFGASSSGSTCYLFVRAYWDNGSTQGGWVVPVGTTFIYYPTINAPTNFSITPTIGQSTVLKWNNTKAGNNSDCQIILYIDDNQVASGIQGSNSGYTIGEDVWKTLGEGNHAIKIAHEYYGRYAYTSSLTFTYKKPYQTISYYTNGNFVPCKVFYYTNNEWKLCNINYYTNGSWKPCSTT